MTSFFTKALTVGGLCALFVVAGGGAFAQGYDHHGWHHHDWHHGHGHARRHLQVLHAVYAHEIKSGHPGAALRAHLRAKAIRAHIRAHH